MKIPLSLIKSFIHLDLSPVQISETLTLLGLEVDRIIGAEPPFSGEELGISSQGDGIIELPQELKLGQDLASVLWDPVFEISLTPNLGHCMCALGIARELSAFLKIPLSRPTASLQETEESNLKKAIKISIEDPALTPRYTCRLIEGINIRPSPFWLQKQLIASGINPICNVVDITNYILLKVGQPLHAFDYDRIEGKVLRVAPCKKAESFRGLDGIDREIPAGTLLISDERRPIAIAGILGGENSAVVNETKNILIEAAVFDPTIVRKAMKTMSLRTESAQRFEKGIDPNGASAALDEACALILELCGGQLAKGIIDLQTGSLSPKRIPVRAKYVNQLLGTHLSLTELEEIFRRLQFSTQETEEGVIQVTVPLFRTDISAEIDLIEEAARIYGYNNITKGYVRCTNSQIPHDPRYLFEKEFRERCVGLGLQEFLTSDLISPKLADAAQEWLLGDAAPLKAIHAKTEEYSILRPSLLPGLLQVAKENFDYKNQSFKAFEIGKIHLLQKNELIEQPMAALLFTGKTSPSHWSGKPSDSDFFDLKGVVENLLSGLNIPAPLFQSSSHLTFHPGRQGNIYYKERVIGALGEVHPALLESFDIKQRLFYAEFNLQLLIDLRNGHSRMHPISSFPASERDWTLSLSTSVPIETIFEAIQSTRSSLLEKAELIDLYMPEAEPTKNATFRFTYRDTLKTISFEEVEAHHNKLVDEILKLLAK